MPIGKISEATPLQAARDARIRGGLDTDYELYKVIDRKPGTSIYDLAKEMNWSSGKVYGSVRRLERDGWVRTEKAERAGRAVLKVIPVEWYEFLTPRKLRSSRTWSSKSGPLVGRIVLVLGPPLYTIYRIPYLHESMKSGA